MLKRTFKDTVFCSLFREKRYIQRLYKRLFHEEISQDEIELATLETELTDGIYNDLSFTGISKNHLK